MKLVPNEDLSPLPFDGEEPAIYFKDVPPEIQAWIDAFPYEAVVGSLPVHLNFRAGQKNETEDSYRRLRISIDLSPWLIIPPNNNCI